MRADIHPLIIVPAFNEASRILHLLHNVNHLKERVLVIDDGSADNTGDIATIHGFHSLRHEKNLGLRGVFQSATQWARARGFTHLITLDADGQHDPAFLPRFMNALEHCDFVTGDRFHDPAGIPPSKLASNLFAILLLREATGILWPDVACGFRGWKNGLFDHLFLNQTPSLSFAIIYEMLLDRHKMGLPATFVRIPAIYHPDEPMSTKIPELKGLLDALIRNGYPQPSESILNRVTARKDFDLHLSDVHFYARYTHPDEYIFRTDTPGAIQLFYNLHNQTRDEQES